LLEKGGARRGGKCGLRMRRFTPCKAALAPDIAGFIAIQADTSLGELDSPTQASRKHLNPTMNDVITY
jgi:hypothetical protein